MKDVLAKAKKWKKNRDERPRELEFAFGEEDQLDLLSYEGLEEQQDHVVIDGVYIRTMFISGYPFSANSGWLDTLVHFNHSADISYHIHQVSARLALPKLQRKITELESTRRMKASKGAIYGAEITDPLNSAEELRDKILRGQEKLFQVSIYVNLRADSLSELDKITKSLENIMASRMFMMKNARYRQLEGLQSILPRGEDVLNQKRNLDTSSAALTFPFSSSELVQEGGILYGVNISNNSLVILDRFSLSNANSITFAQSGKGKSYTSKVEILRHLMQGTKVIVIDPEREYKKLAESVGGTYIELSAKSKNKINPFDLATTAQEKGGLAQHIQNLIGVISLAVEGLEKREKAALDKAIIAVYEKHKKPLLENLHEELHILGQLELNEKLDKFLSGTLSGILNRPSNIDLNNRLIVFDIQEIPENIRQVMMMIVANFIENTVKAKPEKRLLVIDEAWMLLKDEESAKFVSGLVRRARKYYLGVSLISQQANDFLQSEYGRAIASQSSLRILLGQDSTTIDKVVSEFDLSEWERNFLTSSTRGEALIIADQSHVAVTVVASEKEHPLITTDPRELDQ
ncbi:MAG TPA: ATP-binding protein [Candidatus Saccharimonadales bacterium]|nr:ATP-binding protein [Candidatus Saccharimonadales bacterium]